MLEKLKKIIIFTVFGYVALMIITASFGYDLINGQKEKIENKQMALREERLKKRAEFQEKFSEGRDKIIGSMNEKAEDFEKSEMKFKENFEKKWDRFEKEFEQRRLAHNDSLLFPSLFESSVWGKDSESKEKINDEVAL